MLKFRAAVFRAISIKIWALKKLAARHEHRSLSAAEHAHARAYGG
jgi:hypothetical protein